MDPLFFSGGSGGGCTGASSTKDASVTPDRFDVLFEWGEEED